MQLDKGGLGSLDSSLPEGRLDTVDDMAGYRSQ